MENRRVERVGGVGQGERRDSGTNKERTLYNLSIFTVVLLDRFSELRLRLRTSKPLQLFDRVDPSGCLWHRRFGGKIRSQRHRHAGCTSSAVRCGYGGELGRKRQCQQQTNLQMHPREWMELTSGIYQSERS